LKALRYLSAILFAVGMPACAQADPWSITLYGGPATGKIFTQVIAGRFTWDSGMVAVAADRRLARLGWGFNLVGEFQYQQYSFGHTYPSIALGLGLEFHDFPWERQVPTSFSVFVGPTYSYDPPLNYPRSEWGSRKSLLNYIAVEVAVPVPGLRNLDLVMRGYHRSGVWGIYTLDADEVTSIGGGIRWRL
jgi:hypothetical protein